MSGGPGKEPWDTTLSEVTPQQADLQLKLPTAPSPNALLCSVTWSVRWNTVRLVWHHLLLSNEYILEVQGPRHHPDLESLGVGPYFPTNVTYRSMVCGHSSLSRAFICLPVFSRLSNSAFRVLGSPGIQAKVQLGGSPAACWRHRRALQLQPPTS